jgi:very-short-patch-repair endonuclease
MSRSKKFDFAEIKKHARELRNSMTESEILLWDELKNRKLSGYKFLRQHPIIYKGDLIRLNYFIADFYCSTKKAVIELDGPIHDTREDYDQFRDDELQNLGIHILRIKNDELRNINKVLVNIKSFLDTIS